MSLYLFLCRKNPCSGNQENAQQETDGGQSSEEPTVERSVAAAGETNDSTPASSQVPSGVDCSPSAEAVCRPLSPSRFMRRLPPPPGFYLSKEHSYAQLCPLLWRRRYDQAIDCLEKALRQLHAARRRENRLRSTVLRLRDKRLKHTLLMSQDGCKYRGSWTPGGEKRRGTGGSESESDAKCEETGLFEDRCVDQMELGDTNSWSEEEKGYCCYCGRGQVQDGGPVAHRVSKTVRSTVHENSLKVQRRDETRTCGTPENAKDQQIVRLKSVETSDSHVIPAGVLLPDEQSVQLLGSQQKLLLSDESEGKTEAPGQDHHLDLQQQQQLFWIQDRAEGQLILVPLPAGDGLQSFLKTEGVADEAKALLVSEIETHKGELGHMTENRGCVSRVKTACDDEHSEQSSVINTTAVEVGEDVREKLKEHLEGFHLQLSTEFIN